MCVCGVPQVLGKSLFDLADPWMSFVTNGLKAKELLVKDKDYIVRGEEPGTMARERHNTAGRLEACCWAY